MQTHANLKQTEADKRHHREVMRGRSWRYDNKTSAACSLLPSTSQHEHYHLTGLSSHCPHTQPKLAIAVLLLLLLLAPAFNFTRVGRVMASAFCGLPTHMVRVAIRSCAPPPPSIALGHAGRYGQRGRQTQPQGPPQLLGGVYGSCYDCHENWAPSGYRCNQCDAAEFGINQIMLGHSNQRGSGTLAMKCVGVEVLHLNLI